MENKLLSEHKVDLVFLNLKASQCPHILYTVNCFLSMKLPVDCSSFAPCHSGAVCSSSCLSYLTILLFHTSELLFCWAIPCFNLVKYYLSCKSQASWPACPLSPCSFIVYESLLCHFVTF